MLNWLKRFIAIAAILFISYDAYGVIVSSINLVLPLNASSGGTGLDTSGSSGVPSINAGTWIVNNVLTANQVLYGAAGNTITSNANLTYNGTSFVVGSIGPHAIGATTTASVQLKVAGTFAQSTSMLLDSRLQPAAGSNAQILNVAGTLDIAGSGTHALFAGSTFAAPTITAGAGALTKASTVYISNAPTGATTNWALEVAAGNVNIASLAAASGEVTICATTTGLLVKRGAACVGTP